MSIRPTEILLAPVGAGKTTFVLEQLARTLDEQPFARVWVLVSGRRQEDAFRQRLFERTGGRRVYFNVEFFSFYQLYHRLLNIARQPPRMLDDAARYGLLRAILSDLQAQRKLDVYAAIAETPGFIRIIADFIYELKQNLVEPNKFVAVAETLAPKDREIARIYAAYQERLYAHKLVDREGEGWLALSVLQKHPEIGQDVDLLLVDGYDQFTPLQASLLMLVAERARHALVTLAVVPGREDTVGRRFIEAFNQLNYYSLSPPEVIPPSDFLAGTRPAELRHLVDQVFVRGAPRTPANGRVVLIEAPEPAQEAAAVLRRVKRLLLNGAQPDDVLIALRDWPRYAGHFATIGRAYGVPLAMHRGEALNRNPVVMTLLNLLALHESDFRRRDLLDVLRSAYLNVPGIGQEQVEQLDRISQQFVVVGGRANWLNAVARAGQPISRSDDAEEISQEAFLSPEAAQALHTDLMTFFEQITPPEFAPVADYVYWLYGLIGTDSETEPGDDAPDVPEYTFNMPAQIRRAAVPGVLERDLTALDEFMRVLRGLLAAETLLEALHASRDMNRDLFLLELRTAAHNAVMNRGPVRTGRVLVTTVTDARGLPHRHVFIPGLSEGVFPAPQVEDPLYLDSERQALRKRGITLETQAERAADDGLFYQLIGLAHETLTLSRPTVQDGVPWLPSHLWRGVAAVLSDADAIIQANLVRVGEVAQITEAAAPDELLLAAASSLSEPELPGTHNWLLGHYGVQWRHILRAQRIERQRLARGLRHNHYSGRLRDPELIRQVAEQLGPGRVWSATQLNDYGMCAFRFFARRLLRLEALEEPEEGLDITTLGTINHAILEKTYTEVARRGLTIGPENAAEAADILNEVAQPVLASAPRDYGFSANVLWEQEKVALMRRLDSLVRLDFSESNPVTKSIQPGERWPYLQEAPFGTEGGPKVFIPVEINGQAERLRVQGFIDRLDRVGSGVVVIDYKTGTTKIPVEEMRGGRNFQMMLYLHAAQQILAAHSRHDGLDVLGGLFWHIRSREPSGAVRLDEDGLLALDEAQVHLGRNIAAGRRGDFTVHPRKLDQGKCARYCEFSQLCRTASTSRKKPEGDDGTWT